MTRNDRRLRCEMVVARNPVELFRCTILCARAGQLDHTETYNGRVVHVYRPRIITVWRSEIGDDRTRLYEKDIVDCYGFEFTVYVDYAKRAVAMQLWNVRGEFKVLHVEEEPGLVVDGPVIQVIQID